jgi:hypothetical protein
MTSVERHSRDEYKDPNGKVHQQPRYSILTYTWGRFTKEGEEALPVKDTKWKIPPIDPKFFTVDAFQKVVNEHMAIDGIEWAWVDVACINQDSESVENSQEVGRQASIFDKAAAVFVWLWTLDFDTLKATTNNIVQYGLDLRSHIDGDHVESRLTVHEIMPLLRMALESLFADSWFSSLWTLQEIVLRKDAVALSREAELIPWGEDYVMHFVMIINVCQNVWQDVQEVENRTGRMRSIDASGPSNVIDGEVVAIKDLLLSAGFYYLLTDNPNVQYGTAKYRTTLDDTDRIYAIMQTYNIKVGKAADRPDQDPELHPELEKLRHPGFEKLQIEFGAAINRQCPILGQFFTHTEEELPEMTWCITRNSTVPDALMTYRDPRPDCKISLVPDSNKAFAEGSFCLLEDLVLLVKRPPQLDRSADTGALFLDQYVRKNVSHTMESVWKIRLEDLRLIPNMCKKYGRENLLVLWLGDVKAPPSTARGDTERKQIGLVVGTVDPTKPGQEAGQTYYRYGIYIWYEYTQWMTDQVRQLEWKKMKVTVN